MAQLFQCATVAQKKIERWLAEQGIKQEDIWRTELLNPSTVRITNPAGQYMDLACDANNNVRILDDIEEG